jgi:hypothetical protein
VRPKFLRISAVEHSRFIEFWETFSAGLFLLAPLDFRGGIDSIEEGEKWGEQQHVSHKN